MPNDLNRFVAADWSTIVTDFVTSDFFGIDTGKNPNPDQGICMNLSGKAYTKYYASTANGKSPAL